MIQLRQPLLILIFLFSALLANSASANIVNSPGVIAAKHSGKCLNVSGGSTADGSLLVQSICDGSGSQLWTLKPVQDAYQVVVNHSGKCLNVQGASTANGASVIQWPCSDTANNSLWYATLNGDYFQLIAKHSGKCLNVNGATQNVNEKIIQWPCVNANNELWSVGARTHSAIQALHSNQCMDVFGGSTADRAAIIQWGCHGGNNQQWTLMPYQDAYRVVAKHSGKCINVAQASQAEGGAVIQYACVGANNELWYPSQIFGNYYQLSAKHSNKCLTVNANSQTAGATIVQATCSNANNQLWQLSASSAKSGKWSAPIGLSLVPVAAANLPDGRLLLWSSHDRFSFGGGGKTYTSIFDPTTNTATERLVNETGHDMFCPGTSNLADGRILVNGGVNSERTSIYNASTGQWAIGQNMNIARGYHANTVLSNGEVFTLGGSWSGGQGNKNGEVWNSASGWRRIPNILATSMQTADPAGVYRSDNHAWFFGIDNQQVFHAGPSARMNVYNTAGSGTATSAGNRGTDTDSMNGNATMYDVGKIFKVGGATAYDSGTANTNAFSIDINNGAVVAKQPNIAYARSYISSVVLPSGEVAVFGGQAFSVAFTDAQPALAAEIWNPATGLVNTFASAKIPRTYHSVAILLPDARVFVGGGGLCGGCTTNHPNAEIFTPPYLQNADGSDAARPEISSTPSTAAYGSTISVNTNSAITSFALIRHSSITHTVNNDQRRIPLSFTASGTNTYNLSIPSRAGVTIPGYYMLFALNSAGVPSVAKIIRIG